MAPNANAIFPGSAGESICKIKIAVFTAIKAIVIKGNLSVGLSSLKGITMSEIN